MNCKICCELYNNCEHRPIVLMPCGHSYCSKCVSILKQEYPVNCPICREEVRLDKPNYELIETLDNKHQLELDLQATNMGLKKVLKNVYKVINKQISLQFDELRRDLNYKAIGVFNGLKRNEAANREEKHLSKSSKKFLKY